MPYELNVIFIAKGCHVGSGKRRQTSKIETKNFRFGLEISPRRFMKGI